MTRLTCSLLLLTPLNHPSLKLLFRRLLMPYQGLSRIPSLPPPPPSMPPLKPSLQESATATKTTLEPIVQQLPTFVSTELKSFATLRQSLTDDNSALRASIDERLSKLQEDLAAENSLMDVLAKKTTVLKVKSAQLSHAQQQIDTLRSEREIALQLATNSAFRKRFHSIIWNSKLEPHDFEKEWKSCLKEFHISNNKWLQEMYGLRRRWVQKEISDSDNTCFQMSVTSNNCVDTTIVLEKKKNITTRQPSSPVVDDKLEEYHYDRLTEDTQYIVTHSTTDGSYKRTCMHFEHVRILCRHIFCVFKFYSIEQILEEYIMKRWRRDVVPTELLKRHRCVSFLSHDASKLKSYLEELNKLKKKFVEDCPAPEMPSREAFYNQIIGVELTNDAPDIDNPSDIRNKGTGSRGKRLKPKKEMLQKVGLKSKQKCVLCQQMANHDKRNCPLKKRV
ncbi:uncharacterized protein LOC128132354 [Lactuca sativa]|uniref:uncharacterized protein LOC128132354 n=1 Tax=Lactuca sativa TaxID=4236 RepID=UPI0022AFF314|nr:uncharacterized protein LOC128132354 [Lactuca sativa]